jgi:hypothetical protein
VSPLLMPVIAFACVLGGTLFGMFLRNRLPEHHLSAATKDVVRLGTGLIGTIARLVLEMLIASWAGHAAFSHVRNAPLATVGPKKAACRDGPLSDISRAEWAFEFCLGYATECTPKSGSAFGINP